MRYVAGSVILLVISFGMTKITEAEKILFMPAMATSSHVKSMIPLAEELVKDGHKIALVQYYSEERKKVTSDSVDFIYIFIPGIEIIDEEQQVSIWQKRGVNPWTFIKSAWKVAGACMHSIQTEDYTVFYQNMSTLNWDLLIVDSIFQPCGMLFSTTTHGQAWIDYSTTPMLQFVRSFRGVNTPSSVAISLNMENFQPSIFTNRLISAFDGIVEHIFWCILRASTEIQMEGTLFWKDRTNDFFSKAVYSFGSLPLMLDIALPQAMNTFSVDYACPNAVNLTSDYLKFVDDPSSKGTIVFSFGHIADWQIAPAQMVKTISSVFDALPQYRVVWQFNGNLGLVSSSAHVKVKPWIPLAALLQHSKTLLFITHSGIKSFREAICFAVPMLSIPLFGDQVRNTVLTQYHGLGITLDKTDLREEAFYNSILKVLRDQTYKRRIRKVSTMLSDRIMDDTAKGRFWISFFLRHPNSVSHMKLKGTTMAYLAYHGYDVLVLTAIVLLILQRAIH